MGGGSNPSEDKVSVFHWREKVRERYSKEFRRSTRSDDDDDDEEEEEEEEEKEKEEVFVCLKWFWRYIFVKYIRTTFLNWL